MDNSSSDYDVAIVGLGPVGAFAALLLAESGLRVAVLERSSEHLILPRAVGIDGESLRSLQRIGHGDAVSEILQPPREPNEVCFTDSQRRPLFGLEIPKYGSNGWPDISFFDQPELEELLRRLVDQHAAIEVFLGEEVVSLDQDPEGVEVASDSAAGRRSLRAAYVIGCDGAASFVRRAVGIEWTSLGYDQDWLVVDIVQGPEADLPLVMMQVCDPERLTTYVCVKDPNRRWEFQLKPAETREEMVQPEKIEALLRPWLPPEHYEIRRAVVYQFHAATAERWQSGRIFLAGDAAHQTPPFLGQGLNAGFRDAVNLAWKLPLVRAGVCGAELLESYAAERDSHARDLVSWAVAVGKLMETLAAREAGQPDPHPEVDASAGYGQGRTAPPLRGGVLLDAQSRDDQAVGYLLQQPTLRGPDAVIRRLDELIGRGFAIVGRETNDLILGPQARAIFERLGGTAVSLEGLEVVEGKIDPLFDTHPAAVLRPDRYVFGVVDDEWGLDRLIVELGRRLGLR
jgi:3-(3-hydroxy-phenyl)propionate hydroxylase